MTPQKMGSFYVMKDFVFLVQISKETKMYYRPISQRVKA